MKVEEIKITNYIFEYKGKNLYHRNKNIPTRLQISPESDEFLILSPIVFTVNNYLSKVSLIDGQLTVQFGCVTLNEEQIILGYKQLIGEDTSTTKQGLKKGNKGRTLTTNIIEESENFYISSSGKVYKKSEYNVVEYKSDPRIYKFKKNSYYASENGHTIRDRRVGAGDDIKHNMKETFEYYISIIEFLKERRKNGNK